MVSEALIRAKKKYYEKNKDLINERSRKEYSHDMYLEKKADRQKKYRRQQYENNEIYREKSKESSKKQYAQKLLQKEIESIMLILIDN